MIDPHYYQAGWEFVLKFARVAVIIALVFQVLYLVARWIPPED